MPTQFTAYTGRIADIDLTTGSVTDYPVSDRDRELFLGGRFLASKILWDTLRPGVDPLSPENVLVVMTGPLTGSGAPSSSRYDISAKSPLTGGVGHSNSGGNFGIHLKRAGFDGLVIRGAAEKPVYIGIENGKVSIRPAKSLWGLDTQASQAAMGEGGKMVIGPAGENLVRFATVVSQERSHGRGGMGAVMGSKKLKGIVARGKQKGTLADKEGFSDLVKEWTKLLTSHPMTGDRMPKYGTAGFVMSVNGHNALPTRNFAQGRFEEAAAISGETLAREHLVRNYGCVSCPIRCGRVVRIDGKEVKGPEYEILSLMGSNLMVSDLAAIIDVNYRLDLLGMDCISMGNVLGWAAEADENGLWENGLRFGDMPGFVKAVELTAARKGIGDLLAEGVKRLSEKYGGADFAAHAKGMELAAYEPRACVGHGLGYAVAPRGGCHLDGGYMVYFEATGPARLNALHARSKPAWVVFSQNLLAAISAGGNCLFTSWTVLFPQIFALSENKVFSSILTATLTSSWPFMDKTVPLMAHLGADLPGLPHTKALRLATGMEMDFGKFFLVGERGYTLDRMLNLREGMGRKDDTLAHRFLKVPLLPGRPETTLPLSAMLPKYYRLRGWDKNGAPEKKTLKKLGMEALHR